MHWDEVKEKKVHSHRIQVDTLYAKFIISSCDHVTGHFVNKMKYQTSQHFSFYFMAETLIL